MDMDCLNYLQTKLQETGLRQSFIAKKLNVTEKTISRWANLEGIDFTIKFIEFLHICNVCPFEFLNEYNKTLRYKCPKESCQDCKN